MARQITDIRNQMIDRMVYYASLVGLTINPNKWSKTDYKLLTLDTVANEQGVQEQNYDAFVIDVENQIKIAAPQTAQWLRDKLINLFEYDATASPILKLNTDIYTSGEQKLYPYYPNPNLNYRIVKYCSVNKSIWGSVIIKIAGETSGIPSQLGSPVVNAAQSFVNIIGIDGIKYNVVSRLADELYCNATIYYKGIYSAIIQSSVILAIENYLKSIPFNGSVELGDLLISIRKVDGVNRIIFNNITARQSTQSFGDGVKMVEINKVTNDLYDTYAGYIVTETTSGHELTDSLIFIPE